MMPTTAELLTLAVERGSYINTYWNILIGVVTGVLATLVSAKGGLGGSRILKGLLTFVFVVFALSNLQAIDDLNLQRRAICVLITEPKLEAVVTAIQPLPRWTYVVLHLVLDAAVVACVWCIPWPRR